MARQAGARLGERAGRRRVGLAWQGLTRSLPFEAFAPLLDLPGVQWVSLQFKDQAGDPRLLQVMGDGRFDRTAAMVANLDLVITIDSSLAHLGGALGVPTWVLLDHAACWRWMESGGTTPWYDSVTVYRQDQPGDWRPVIEAVRRDLSPLTAS